MKLQINCVVEDDKIGTEFLEEEITKFEDYVSWHLSAVHNGDAIFPPFFPFPLPSSSLSQVQSVDIAAFNKL